MKYSVYAFLMVVGAGVFLPKPFVTLSAAELWNKPSGTSDNASGNKLYNSSGQYGKDVVLYNRSVIRPAQRNVGSASAIEAYKNVRRAKQKSSKLWKFMSSNAIVSRQSDIDATLQMEYELQVANSKFQIQQEREYQKQLQAEAKLYGEQLDKYRAAKAKEKQQKLSRQLQMLKQKGAFKDDASGGQGAGSSQERVSKATRPRLFNEIKK